MADYDIHFADELATVATGLQTVALTSIAQERMRLYLSLLSIEISLKAMLEQAGVPVPDIRARSHNIKSLLQDLDKCTIEEDVVSAGAHRVPASRLRSVVINNSNETGTVGQLIDRLDGNLSTYPNQVRYGSYLRHFSSELVADASRKINNFGKRNWSSLQLGDA